MKKISSTEQKFINEFQNQLYSNDIIYQYPISVPFTKNHKHYVDFYIPSKDLYIEIKGFMTYTSVNILKYLLYESNKNFYIFQMTEEDWIEEYNKEKHKSIKNKLQNNFEIQINEIKMLLNNKLSSENLTNFSKYRLNNYIDIRNNDLIKWKNIKY